MRSLSFWNIARDRSRLKITSVFYGDESSGYGPVRLVIRAINTGRRPIYIRSIGGGLMKNGWMSTHVGTNEFGVKLEEGQAFEHTLAIDEVLVQGPDFEDEFRTIWLEDSLGRRHKVPKAKQYLERLKASNESMQPMLTHQPIELGD